MTHKRILIAVGLSCLWLFIVLVPCSAMNLPQSGAAIGEAPFFSDEQELSSLGKVAADAGSQLAFAYQGGTLWNGATFTLARGNFVYASMYLGLVTIDISNPSSPQIVSRLYLPDFHATDMDVAGDFLYVTTVRNERSLRIFDITNPGQPVSRGYYKVVASGSSDNRIAVHSNFVYMAFGGDIQVIDVGNPDHPALARTITGPSGCLEVVGDILYYESTLTPYTSAPGLRIVNLAVPESPVSISAVPLSKEIYDIAVSGNFAYVTDADSFLHVIDIASAAVVESYSVHNPDRCLISGDYLYLSAVDTYTDDSLKVFDISAAPVLSQVSSTVFTNSYALSSLTGNFAILGAGFGGLDIVDISSPVTPQKIGAMTWSSWPSGRSVEVSGNYAYVAGSGGLAVIDISVAQAPVVIAEYGTGEARGLVLRDNIAYVTSGAMGLQLLDISNPTEPALLGAYDTPVYANDVFLAGSFAYVADGKGGLRVVDVSNPSSPTEVGSWADSNYNVTTVTVHGNYAYMTEWNASLSDPAMLFVIDIANATNPEVVSTVILDRAPVSVTIFGDYLIVGCDLRIKTFDLSDPVNPSLVNDFHSPYGDPYGVTFVGNNAYIANYFDGLLVLNFENPTDPTFVGSYNTLSGWAFDVAVEGENVYIATDNGFMILKSQSFQCGDSDGDATVNVSDAVYLIGYIFAGGPAPTKLGSGDPNCDQLVNISDAVYLIAYVFGGGPVPCDNCLTK